MLRQWLIREKWEAHIRELATEDIEALKPIPAPAGDRDCRYEWGDCTLKQDEKELLPWQVRRKAPEETLVG